MIQVDNLYLVLLIVIGNAVTVVVIVIFRPICKSLSSHFLLHVPVRSGSKVGFHLR